MQIIPTHFQFEQIYWIVFQMMNLNNEFIITKCIYFRATNVFHKLTIFNFQNSFRINILDRNYFQQQKFNRKMVDARFQIIIVVMRI